jgi:hypothetical protein
VRAAVRAERQLGSFGSDRSPGNIVTFRKPFYSLLAIFFFISEIFADVCCADFQLPSSGGADITDLGII